MGQAPSNQTGGNVRLIATPGADDPCARFGPSVLSNGGPYTLIAVNISEHSTSIGDTLVLGPAISSPGDANRRSLAVRSSFIPCFRSMC